MNKVIIVACVAILAGQSYYGYKMTKLYRQSEISLAVSEEQNAALAEECLALRGYISDQLAPMEVGTAQEEKTLAQLNNNPLNIKGQNWLGQIGRDKFGHAIFASVDHGFRAAARLLLNYKTKHGIDTIDALVERFCTGNKQSYKQFLSSHLGIDAKTKFDMEHYLPELLRYMAKFESGQWFDEELFLPYSLLSSR